VSSIALRALRLLLRFALAMAALCCVNFLAQIALIFVDLLTRLESSSAAILALWFVTGVFTTVFALGDPDRSPDHARFGGNLLLALSLAAIGLAVAWATALGPGGDPLEFSLMFTNTWVVIAFFAGSGAMAWVFRKLGPERRPPAPSR
jgi:hypothetical protein